MIDNRLIEIQKLIHQILIEFDEFCNKYSLIYYLSCGSLLGAIRHGGFIPWDDDIDVSMPREDYERLLTEYYKYLPDHLKIMTYKNTDNYELNFAKIMNINTTIVEQNGENVFRVQGAYIDIFPIDGAGKTYKKAILRRKLIQPLLTVSTISASSKEKINNTATKKWKIQIMKVIRLIGHKRFQNLLTWVLKRKSYYKSEYVAVYVGAYKYKEILPRSVYGAPIKMKFNDSYFNSPAEAATYLNSKYGGDYMKLPPEEKRTSHHKFVYVDMNLPYEKCDIEKLEKEFLD